MTSSPTLFNSGTLRPQLSSCYLTTIDDDLYDIYGAMRDNAMLSKWAGGLGNDWRPVRALNSYIKGTNGKSQGVVPFLKVANDTAVAVNQGGKRKGKLEIRITTGDHRRLNQVMNKANCVPDLFMQSAFDDTDWTLMTPSETRDIHDLTGAEFVESYAYYAGIANETKILHIKMRAI